MSRTTIRAGRAALALLLAGGCGGGSSPSTESKYPSVTGTYGAGGTVPFGTDSQLWVAADGSAQTVSCNVIVRILAQNGAQWSGSLERSNGCTGIGAMAGDVDTAGAVRFTLTQQRWRACTAQGAGSYAGTIVQGTIYAKGTTTVLCDEGGRYTVEETLNARSPEPPSTPG